MRALALFIAGLGFGILVMQPTTAQKNYNGNGLKLNHVGIAVKNFDQAIDYYTKTFGFREAFAFKEPDGRPILTYLQINRDTFLEVQPATADRPAGITHFGLDSPDLKAAVARLQQRGVKVNDPMPSTRTMALLTSATDADGIRMELLEFGPGSLQRKAILAWK
jgi:catechol 2,3-dioxygenase-like lactoylglutathione lyase family enzyme